MTSLSPEEQVDIYEMAIGYFRPPDTRLAAVLAKQGARILPALVAKLETEDPRVAPQQLVLVLYMMDKHYHVPEARKFAPRVDGWCSRAKTDTYCFEMGREMMELNRSRYPRSSVRLSALTLAPR